MDEIRRIKESDTDTLKTETLHSDTSKDWEILHKEKESMDFHYKCNLYLWLHTNNDELIILKTYTIIHTQLPCKHIRKLTSAYMCVHLYWLSWCWHLFCIIHDTNKWAGNMFPEAQRSSNCCQWFQAVFCLCCKK